MEKTLAALMERASVAEKVVNSLKRESSEKSASRKRKMNSAMESVEVLRDSLEKRESDLEEREREFLAFQERKMREFASEEKRLSLKKEKVGIKLMMIKEKEESLILDREEFLKKENKVNAVIDVLEDRIIVVEKKEEEFELFKEEKMRDIALEEEKLKKKWEEFAEHVREREKSRDDAGGESLALSVKKADLIRESLEKKMEEFEKMKTEFIAFQEEKIGEMTSKEQLLAVMSEELAKDTMLRNEQLMEREKFGHRLLERLELAKNDVEGLKRRVGERFEEICLKETELKSIRDWVRRKLHETDLKTEGFEEQEKRIAEREDHLISKENELQGKEMSLLVWERELKDKQKEFDLAREASEQLLGVLSKELMRDAELRNEQLLVREKLGHELLERLSLAKDNVERLQRRVREGYVKNSLKETELESIRGVVQKKMDETDLKAKEFEEREERIARKENHLIYKENELKGKEKTLFAREKGLEEKQKEVEDKQKEVDLVRKSSEQQMEILDKREKSLNSVREFTRNCFQEHRDIKRKLATERDLVQQSARDIAQRSEHLNHALKDLELREKQLRDAHKELKLKEQHSTNVCDASSKIKPDESGAEIKLTLRMDGKTLQMFLNDTEKDLESMCDEIFKVLQLSSDPAKLVLDSMVGFYPPHLRTEDVEFNVRRTCIALLGQLIKISPTIKPYVREEAIQVATTWKLKLGATCENAKLVEVLGFLLLLSAFDLVSYFDEGEIYSYLKMVDQHSETPRLHCVRGFAEST